MCFSDHFITSQEKSKIIQNYYELIRAIETKTESIALAETLNYNNDSELSKGQLSQVSLHVVNFLSKDSSLIRRHV